MLLCDSVVKELNKLNTYNVLVYDILPTDAVTSDIMESSGVNSVATNQIVSENQKTTQIFRVR